MKFYDSSTYSLTNSCLKKSTYFFLHLKCCSSLRMHYCQVIPIFFLLNVSDTLKTLKTQQNWIRPPKNSQTFTFSKFLSFINVSRAMVSSVITWNIVVCVLWEFNNLYLDNYNDVANQLLHIKNNRPFWITTRIVGMR